MPRLSKWYDEGLQNYITPYLYPIMQTSLTTSVYMTVVIAVYAFVYIKPVPKGPEEEDSNDDDDPEERQPLRKRSKANREIVHGMVGLCEVRSKRLLSMAKRSSA